MLDPPARFAIGPHSFVLIRASGREFAQSKFEYDYEVFKDRTCGHIHLWFFPSRPEELRGRLSYELRRSLPADERGEFCEGIFDSLKAAHSFKSYEIDTGDAEFRGPVAALPAR